MVHFDHTYVKGLATKKTNYNTSLLQKSDPLLIKSILIPPFIKLISIRGRLQYTLLIKIKSENNEKD